MSKIQYPLDVNWLLKNKRKLLKASFDDSKNCITVKIAILGGSTTNGIADYLKIFLQKQDINPLFYESQYNKYFEDGYFSNEELTQFAPQIVLIHTSNRNIKSLPCITDNDETIEQKLLTEFNNLKLIWQKLRERFGCIIIQNNFEKYFTRLMGNQDIIDYRGKNNFIHRLNSLIYEEVRKNSWLYLNDLDYFASSVGLDRFCDLKSWYLYKTIMPLDLIPVYSYNIFKIIKSLYGKNKKALIVDLDNTLWGGVVGDDGVDNIEIGPETAQGECFEEIQQYIKQLKQQGVILAINSKNNIQNVQNAFANKNMKLSLDDFSCVCANWNSKDVNMQIIAKELNIGKDAFVFLDDNPAEREVVKSNFDEIACLNVDEPEMFIKTIDNSGFFETSSFTGEDVLRNQMYEENKKRTIERENFLDYNEYLQNLNMQSEVDVFNDANIARVTQLINKTNQFNLTTARWTEEHVKCVANNKNNFALCARLKDKFGDNGIVSVIACSVDNDELIIDLFLMSCRVLQRGLEYVMIDLLAEYCKKNNIKKIIGIYKPTEKNKLVENLYDLLGFELVKHNNEGKYYCCAVKNYVNKNKIIKVVKNYAK